MHDRMLGSQGIHPYEFIHKLVKDLVLCFDMKIKVEYIRHDM